MLLVPWYGLKFWTARHAWMKLLFAPVHAQRRKQTPHGGGPLLAAQIALRLNQVFASLRQP